MSDQDSEFFESYSKFASTLRTWFIAYGIGGPVIFITSKDASEKLFASKFATCVGILFLVGVAIQVLNALIYKAAMSYLYLAEGNKKLRGTYLYKFFYSLTEWFWLELVLDLATLIAFGWAAVVVFRIFTS